MTSASSKVSSYQLLQAFILAVFAVPPAIDLVRGKSIVKPTLMEWITALLCSLMLYLISRPDLSAAINTAPGSGYTSSRPQRPKKSRKKTNGAGKKASHGERGNSNDGVPHPERPGSDLSHMQFTSDTFAGPSTSAPGGRSLDTLSFGAWQVLGLVHDIARRHSHTLVLTVQRTRSKRPRTFYALHDVQIAPLTEAAVPFARRFGQPPTRMLAQVDAVTRAQGHLGTVLVMVYEQGADDKRSPREMLATGEEGFVIQLLTLYNVARRELFKLAMMSAAVQTPPDMWKLCIKNSLDGGAYSPRFVPQP
ncbi:hypothetical protein FA95DRAFT_1577062 [Auriscalpium vulgare]|uniref:Uncharacterized protein n=1 Tax=Auriscalpium vulgare TaxID=40419 RepID=A0ACB8R7Z3_9AGAM|nr:hypothetical protein FA95DRAFT_1577062 [Auriscalpium vulgare]